MQRMKYYKHINLSLVFGLAMLTITPASFSLPCDQKTIKQVIGGATLFTTLACFIRLVTKKTQPKRVYPKDDSFSEIGWYIFDELLTGQMEKGERAHKVTIDPENPNEFVVQYSKVESRGVAGILYSTLKPVIIPTLTFMLLFNKDIIEKIKWGIIDTRKFLDNPAAPFEIISGAITNDLKSFEKPVST